MEEKEMKIEKKVSMSNGNEAEASNERSHMK